MFKSNTGRKFRSDLDKAQKQRKNIAELKEVMDKLCKEIPLEPKYKDHPLKGNWIGRRECHLAPDWLLIYQIRDDEKAIYFERLGSHSDLFS